MLIGYARTSTLDQEAGFAAQLAELKAAGCERVYSEQLSSLTDRPQLEAMLNYIRTGDVAYVTSIDRLARDMADLLNIQARIAKAGATLRIRGLVDTADASGVGYVPEAASVLVKGPVFLRCKEKTKGRPPLHVLRSVI